MINIFHLERSVLKEKQDILRSEGFAFIGLGMALAIGSSIFFENFLHNKRRMEEDNAIYNSILKKVKTYFQDCKNDYDYLTKIATNADDENKLEKIRNWLLIRTKGLERYSENTENDIQTLQLKNPPLYDNILKVIQSNKVLLHKSYFQDIQHGFENDTLQVWLEDVTITLTQIQEIERQIASLLI